MKRTLLKILFFSLLASCLLLAVSCKKKTPVDPSEETESPLIAGESGSVFTIVYPDRWTNYEEDAADQLQKALKKSYASFPKVENDGKNPSESDAYEILVGNTNRSESSAALDDLNEYGWAVRVIGHRIVINAKNGQFLEQAAQYFIETYAQTPDQLVLKNISDHIYNVEKYDQPYVISVGDRSVYTACYTVSASDYLKSSIHNLSAQLRKNGVTLPAKEGTVSGRSISTTIDKSVNGYRISFETNGNITVTGQDAAMAVNGLNRLLSDYLKKDSDGDIIINQNQKGNQVSDAPSAYTRDGWLLASPAYDGGTLAPHLYDCGTGNHADNNSASSERSFMMCVSQTSSEQFSAYEAKLLACGYALDSSNAVKSSTGKDNFFRGYRKGSQYLWLYYLAETEEVRVIDDRASTPVSEFAYAFDYDNNTATELYLYGMQYDEQGGSGAFFIIKQADGSVILIDGGSKEQITAASGAVADLWNFLHTITGKAKDEKIVIACWFVTHPHGDHHAFVSALIRNYHDKLDLQRVMFNFPNPDEATKGVKNGENMGIDNSACEAVSTYFPNAMFLKCHTGQKIRLGSLTIDVMITHEDAVNAESGRSRMPEGNAMTSVVRFTFADGTRYLELGDFTGEESASEKSHYMERQQLLAQMYAASEFECEITSIAHHGYNSLPYIYPKIKAQYALWTNTRFTSFESLNANNQWKWVRSEQIKTQLSNSGVTPTYYYAAAGTVKLECKNGTITASQNTLIK